MKSEHEVSSSGPGLLVNVTAKFVLTLTLGATHTHPLISSGELYMYTVTVLLQHLLLTASAKGLVCTAGQHQQ